MPKNHTCQWNWWWVKYLIIRRVDFCVEKCLWLLLHSVLIVSCFSLRPFKIGCEKINARFHWSRCNSIGQGVGNTHLWYSSDILTWDIYSEVWDVVIKFCCLSFVPLLYSRCSLADMPIQQLRIVSNHSTSSGHDFIILVFCGYIMNADVCTVPSMGTILTF